MNLIREIYSPTPGGKFRSLLTAGIALIVIALLIKAYTVNIFYDPEKIIHRMEHDLLEKEEEATETTNAILHSDRPLTFMDIREQVPIHAEEKGLFHFTFFNDSLVFWSSNAVPLYTDFMLSVEDNQLEFLENGWYLARKQSRGPITHVVLIEIYYDYPYRNALLRTGYFEDFHVPEWVGFDQSDETHPILSSSGTPLFSLVFPEEIPLGPDLMNLLFLIYVIALLCIFNAIYHAYGALAFFHKGSLVLFLLFTFDVVLIRSVLIYFEIPEVLYTSGLFGPFGFASSWWNRSLGDTLVNALILLNLAYVFYRKISLPPRRDYTLKNQLIYIGLLLIVSILFLVQTRFIHTIVRDSSFSFNLRTIYSLNYQSVLGFIILSCLFLSYFLFLRKITIYISNARTPYWWFPLVAGLLFSVLAVIGAYTDSYHPADLLILALITFIIYYFRFNSNTTIGFGASIIFLLLFSIYSNIHLNTENRDKELKYMELLINELANERDPSLEFDIRLISKKIMEDEGLPGVMEVKHSVQDMESRVERYLLDHYFSALTNKYRVQITCCQEQDILEIQPEGYLIPCYAYFDTIVDQMGLPTMSPNLFFLKDQSENNNYLAVFKFNHEKGISTNVFVELYSRLMPEEGLGYPELLIDQENNFVSDLSNYSYARYRGGALTYKFGDYSYSLDQDSYPPSEAETITFVRNGFEHLMHRAGPSHYIIISKEVPDLLGRIAPFSYLFLIFGIFSLLFLVITLLPGILKKLSLDFSDRLQITIISIILVSFVIVGITSRLYIIRLNETKNISILKEKTYSALAELEHKLSDPNLDSSFDYEAIMKMLNKFSLVLFSDINLYDRQGELVATSRPEIFEAGLISTQMHPEAYEALLYQTKLEFVHSEKIGKQDYYSSYVPFMDANRQIIGYLNLPYFAKQREIQTEISRFLIAYINIYILAVIFALILTIIVSTYITRPLEFIKLKMRNVRLGKLNEKITWKHHDEIGSLVMEYNRMLDELEASAEKLAQSEREMAWREMAQQVAHEIKNPLTPMKLSVQHLQRSWDPQRADWPEYITKFTNTLIEQIDSLSQIAGAFSDFASMPKPAHERLEITELLNHMLELYKDYKDIAITVEIIEPSIPAFIFADKQQMIRVLHNLIRNSIQALSGKKDGKIILTLKTSDGYHVIGVTDNGTGIDPSQGEKIFLPSFTTKSSGMGLGLAIVRNIIRSFGGRIDFQSARGKGTTFYVYMPVYE